MTKILSLFRTSFRLKFFSALFLTLLADFLFYGHQAGWTVGLFGFLLMGAFTVHNFRTLGSRTGQMIVFLTFVQCVLMIEKASLLSLCLFGCGMVSLVLLSQGGWRQDALVWIRKITAFFVFILYPLSKAAITLRKYQRRYMPQNTLEIFMRGWLLPIVLSLVFLLLFSSANPIITRWVSAVNPEFLVKLLSLGRVFFWLVAGAMIFAVIRPKVLPRKTRRLLVEADTDEPRVQTHKSMRLTEWAFTKESVLRSLILFNLMFACQTALDIHYLWVGMDLPSGITYARYAQQGAYPLIVTALLAAVFVLITQNAEPEVSGSRTVRRLIYLWVVQNVLLVVSSIYRTNMYVEVYALTYWRVAALIWMGLVACGLCWIIVRSVLNKSNTWLINVNVLTLIGVLYITSFVNIGGMIAHYNVMHSKEISGKGVMLDHAYLEDIGSAAIPALKIYAEKTPLYLNHDHVTSMTDALRRDMDDWRRWTYSEVRLLKSLESQE